MLRLPILYSFRRCPYAMRARLAIAAAGVSCVLREVVLRDKPAALLAASPKGTVPVLVDVDGRVIEESLDIMVWALQKKDPLGWMPATSNARAQQADWIADCEREFKPHLDRYKYASRFTDVDAAAHRDRAAVFLARLNRQLATDNALFGDRRMWADIAILPFVRQFALTDADWFAAQPWPHLQRWLDAFLAWPLLEMVMTKFEAWDRVGAGVVFPDACAYQEPWCEQ